MNSLPAFHSNCPQIASHYGFNGLRFEEVNYTCGFQMPEHTHEAAFLDLCLEGTIQDLWTKEAFVRGPFTLNFVPISAPHGSHFREGVRTFQIVLPVAWLERIQQIAPLTERLTTYSTGLPVWIVMRLYREFQRRDDLSPLVLEGILLELFGEMARSSTGLAQGDCPLWLRQAQDFLHAHFTESPSVETIATAVGVHPSHLMRGFRQRYRSTIGDYVRRLRVEYACHLLSTSEAPPAQIAFMVGFADQSHFNRTFKSCTGLTPAAFQKVSGRASLRQELIV